MPGIIGRKLGMTSYITQEGHNIPCTVVEAGPCVVTQVKDEKKDGYRAVQLAFGEKKEKHSSKPATQHFAKANTTPKQKVVEIRNFREDFADKVKLGNTITIDDVFSENDYLDAIGVSKGKGFQGVVKRHGFAGVGDATHGQHNRLRAPGSVGGASTPSRVFKGLKMAGRTGNQKVKVLNLKVVKIFSEKNIMLVSGAIPGANNSFVVLEK